jgi:hypothetical protein
MLNYPMSSTENTKYKKSLWTKMYQCSHLSEAIRSLGVKQTSKGAYSTGKGFTNSRFEVPSDLKMNTAQGARNVREILNRQSITISLFKKEVVSSNKGGRLLRYLIQWSEYNEITTI